MGFFFFGDDEGLDYSYLKEINPNRRFIMKLEIAKLIADKANMHYSKEYNVFIDEDHNRYSCLIQEDMQYGSIKDGHCIVKHNNPYDGICDEHNTLCQRTVNSVARVLRDIASML